MQLRTSGADPDWPVLLLAGCVRARPNPSSSSIRSTTAPLEVKLLPNEKETEAVKEFHATGQNRYRDAPAALAEGKELYEQHCQSCHLPDGSGRLGPSLITRRLEVQARRDDVGMFEVIYAGAAGAMQSFFRRGVTQDETLKMIAYVRTLKK